MTGGTRRWAWVARALGALLVVLLVATLGVAWYFADQLTLPPETYPYPPDTEVLAVDGDLVTLPRSRFADVDGDWGLQVAGRTVQLVEQVAIDDTTVTWRWTGDAFTPAVGDAAKIDEYTWATDPFEAHGLPFDPVTVDGPVGDLPAWWVPADGDPVGTVVFVHGRGATRAESLRFLPAMVAAGWNVLVPTYRGDAGAPPLPDGRVRFGTAEWADLEAAVRSVSDRDGALVLFGSSMGGAMIGQLLDRSPETDVLVDGVVLDSPLLSMDDLLDLQAGRNGLPAATEPVVLPIVQLLADWRFDLDADSLEQTEPDGTFDVPVLLFHGEDDEFVPVAGSRRFAAAHGTVTWHRVREADHVRSWNHDRAGYEAALVAFLTAVGGAR